MPVGLRSTSAPVCPPYRRERVSKVRVLLMLALALTNRAPLSLSATDRSHPHASTKDSSKEVGRAVDVLFEYNPPPLSADFKNSEYVFVWLATDGSTQVVRYGPYDPSVIAVYEGKLPMADATRLIASQV